MRQLFLVFDKDLVDVETQQAELNALMSFCHLDLDSCDLVERDDERFGYYLVSLPHSLVTQQVEDIKANVRYLWAKFKGLELEGSTAPSAEQIASFALSAPCDVLMSSNFPCFSAQDTRPGALVMDMDMTSVQIEGIDEIARRLGVYDEVAAITAEAMHGNMNFATALRRRVALLKGGDAKAIIEDIGSSMPQTPGLGSLLNHCKLIKAQSKFECCIASGGFHELISYLDKEYGLDRIAANRLQVDSEGHFTGEVLGDIVDAEAKANLVRRLKSEGIPKERIIVLGDGANDLKMMHEGGLAIAYHAKPKVQAQALNALNHGDLNAVEALLEMRSELYLPSYLVSH